MTPRTDLLLLSLLSAAATAQQTWTVGTGGHFASLSEANSAVQVQPGDTLQITSSTLPGFTLTKGVTVRGPATITDFAWNGACYTTIQVPAGQRARLLDLQFAAGCYGPSGNVGALDLSAGQVTLERCSGTGMGTTVRGADCAFVQCTLQNGGLRVESGTVTLHGCTFVGSGAAAGLAVLGGAVAAVTSSFTGGPHWCFGRNGCQGPAPSGSGILVQAGFLHGAGLQCQGGTNSGWPFLGTGAGVQFVSGRLWLSDSILTGGGHSYLPGGAGLDNSSGVPARLARCTLVGGAGTTQGPPSVGPVDPSAPLFGVRTLQADLMGGNPYQIRFLGPPGDALILLMSARLQRLDTPLVEQPLWVFADPAWVSLAAGVFDLTGALGFDLMVPGDAALVDQSFWFHGIGGTGVPLQAAPPVGGYIR